METHGFAVTRHYLGLETAWRAEFTAGKDGSRVLGINSEMDALAGIGHACGHNLIAVSGVGVAIAVKAALQTHGVSGKVVLLGTPGESFHRVDRTLLNTDLMNSRGRRRREGYTTGPWGIQGYGRLFNASLNFEFDYYGFSPLVLGVTQPLVAPTLLQFARRLLCRISVLNTLGKRELYYLSSFVSLTRCKMSVLTQQPHHGKELMRWTPLSWHTRVSLFCDNRLNLITVFMASSKRRIGHPMVCVSLGGPYRF